LIDFVVENGKLPIGQHAAATMWTIPSGDNRVTVHLQWLLALRTEQQRVDPGPMPVAPRAEKVSKERDSNHSDGQTDQGIILHGAGREQDLGC